jgi:hypothetical protein
MGAERFPSPAGVPHPIDLYLLRPRDCVVEFSACFFAGEFPFDCVCRCGCLFFCLSSRRDLLLPSPFDFALCLCLLPFAFVFSLAFAPASRYAKASALGLSRRSRKAGFSPWGVCLPILANANKGVGSRPPLVRCLSSPKSPKPAPIKAIRLSHEFHPIRYTRYRAINRRSPGPGRGFLFCRNTVTRLI